MYDASVWLFWYRLIFTVSLIAAEMLFLCRLCRKKYFVLRAFTVYAACIGLSFALPVLYNVAYIIGMFIGIFVLTVLAALLCFDASMKNIVICVIAGYTVQHISQEIFEIFNISARINDMLSSDFYGSEVVGGNINAFVVTVFFYIYGMIYWGAYMLFSSKIFPRENAKLLLSVFIVVVAMILMDIVLSALVTYVLPPETDKFPVLLLHIYNIGCCVFALFMLFELPRRKRAEAELAVFNDIMEKGKAQYAASKENIALINLKAHDIKHYMLANSEATHESEKEELQKILDVYDSSIETGNEALDVVLTEKNIICKKRGIGFFCMADGGLLSFMKDADIYSMFGNILDNAIEAAEKLERGRRISLSVRKTNSFIVINVTNGYSGEITFQSGLPVTTKSSFGRHGYGIKSIKYTAERYGGEMSVSANNGLFTVNVLFSV